MDGRGSVGSETVLALPLAGDVFLAAGPEFVRAPLNLHALTLTSATTGAYTGGGDQDELRALLSNDT